MDSSTGDRNLAEDVMWSEVQTLRERTAALEQKCILLEASLKQADARVAELESAERRDYLLSELDERNEGIALLRAQLLRLREACDFVRAFAEDTHRCAVCDFLVSDCDCGGRDIRAALAATATKEPTK